MSNTTYAAGVTALAAMMLGAGAAVGYLIGIEQSVAAVCGDGWSDGFKARGLVERNAIPTGYMRIRMNCGPTDPGAAYPGVDLKIPSTLTNGDWEVPCASTIVLTEGATFTRPADTRPK